MVTLTGAGSRAAHRGIRPARRASALWHGSPWWLRVIVVYLLARLASTAILLLLAANQGANAWTAAHPGYFDYASLWDGRWYNIVAGWGYPATLPHTADGHVGENAWAFLPGYPAVVTMAMFVTRLPWSVAAVLVSAGFGVGAALVCYRLMRLRLGESASMFAVVLFCVAPVSPLMQLAYAESMYLFLLALALYLLVQRRYGLLMPVVVVMAFTRPSGLAFALALGLHTAYRWLHRGVDPFPVRERWGAVTATVVSLAAGAAWPVIAGLVTGMTSAYTDTELAWRSAYIGYVDLVPFSAWLQGAHWWFSTFLHAPAWLGYAALVLVVAGFAAVLFSPAVRRLGVDLRIWLASYGLYLLAVFFPQSSTFRLLMPMFPLVGAAAVPRHPLYRVTIVVLCLAGQVGWLLLCWGVDGADWSPP